jgi:heme-degrading monooxygenase HmoA
MVMATVAVRNRVADFDAWKIGFDEHGTARKERGSTGATVLRDASDPNEVLVLINWPSLENAHAFANDPSLREAMEKSGVIGAPRIEFYGEADS